MIQIPTLYLQILNDLNDNDNHDHLCVCVMHKNKPPINSRIYGNLSAIRFEAILSPSKTFSP